MPINNIGTYHSCYSILEQVRLGINEYSEALVQGAQMGTHQNKFLVNEINKAQMFIYSVARKRLPEGFFVDSATVAGVNSVYTLPWDFGSLIAFLDASGLRIFPIGYDQLKLSTQTGSKRRYYQKGQTLVLDKDGETANCTIWYNRKPREIHSGRFEVGGTGSCTLGNNAKRIADYYNGMIVESVDGDWHDTISDYTAARVATVTAGRAVTADNYYGIVPELPDYFHDLISERAILTVKAISPVAKAKPKQADYLQFEEQLLRRIQENQQIAPDGDIEQVFSDFGPRMPGYGIVSG